jgi:hypothetical protein
MSSLWRNTGLSEPEVLIKEIYGLVRLYPSKTAAISIVEANSFSMQFCSLEFDGSGRQIETKSPPGPNLHSGSPW